MSAVLVLGAGGTMGARVAALLRRELPGATVIGASRRGPRALGAGARSVDLLDAASLARGLEGVGVVVNAVGPYRYDPAPLLRACAFAGAHYVDLAEAPAFLAAVARAVEQAGAAARGVVAVPGASTTPGLLEIVLRRLGAGPGADSDAWLSMGSRNRVSAGLLFGLLRPMGRPLEGGAVCFGRVESRVLAGRTLRFGRHPCAVAGTRLHVGFDRALLVRALHRAAPLLARASDASLARLVALALPLAGAARAVGTGRGLLHVACGERAVEIEARARGLDVPAAPAVWAVRRLLEGGAGRAGAVALADLVPAEEAFAWLRAAGYLVREGVPSVR